METLRGLSIGLIPVEELRAVVVGFYSGEWKHQSNVTTENWMPSHL